MGDKNICKFFIIALICVVLVLGGCSSNESQDQAQDCSPAGLRILGRYYTQLLEKADQNKSDDPSSAYESSAELLADVAGYDHPACANTAHSHLVTTFYKATEGYRLALDGKFSEVADAMYSASEEVLIFLEEFQKLEAKVSEP